MCLTLVRKTCLQRRSLTAKSLYFWYINQSRTHPTIVPTVTD
jgi:hypothetical protein